MDYYEDGFIVFEGCDFIGRFTAKSEREMSAAPWRVAYLRSEKEA